MENFKPDAYAAFEEAALDKYDFTTCQRPDGSKYGSNGRCIKGSETSPASKDDKKKSSKSGGGGGSVPAPGTPERKKFDAQSDLDSAKKTLARKDLTSAERARATTMKNQAEKDLKAAKKGKWDDFNKKSKAEAEKIRKKYANKKPDGGLTEAQVRAGGGRLD